MKAMKTGRIGLSEMLTNLVEEATASNLSDTLHRQRTPTSTLFIVRFCQRRSLLKSIKRNPTTRSSHLGFSDTLSARSRTAK